jgi:DNA-binding NarL/FixJ family response regulator
MSNFKRRVLVVEDDPFVGSLLAEALRGQGFEVQLVDSALKAKKILKNFDPDAALLDIGLGTGPSGIDLAQYLRLKHPQVAPILLTRQSVGADAASIPEGVGFLRKSLISDTAYLVSALEDALRDRGNPVRHDAIIEPALRALTKNQREVLHLLALGYSNAEIAKKRGITVSGAEQNVTAIFKAFGLDRNNAVDRRVEVVRRYIAAVGIPDRPAE